MEIDKKNNYIVRQATPEDSKRVWEIRNYPENRKNFCNQKKIGFESHDKWFENKYFEDKDNFCFVLADEDNEVIGYCRLDFDDRYIVSIAIDSDCHGKGLGSSLLKESIDRMDTKKEILAEVKKGNMQSYKLFTKHNFMLYKEDESSYYFRYKRD